MKRFKNKRKAFLPPRSHKHKDAHPMHAWNPENERLAAECYLRHRQTDFAATYMEVSNLQYVIARRPDVVTPETADALYSVLCGTAHTGQRQVFFLFKKAADALAAILRQPTSEQAGRQARSILAKTLRIQSGPAFRAAAEAMGTLPLEIRRPGPAEIGSGPPRIRPLGNLHAIAGGLCPESVQWQGRSLVVPLSEEPGRLLVLKFARPGQPASELAAEAMWMQHLSDLRDAAGPGIDIPEPLPGTHPVVYRVSRSALVIPQQQDIDPKRYAVAFTVRESYFSYPNHPAGHHMISKDACRSILARSARIFGHLAARGIIHTAPIPLFHNRVQRHRRQDHGLYQWHRGGRLDQWLASCRYPNICRTGIRDFEHFLAFDGSARSFYQHIGAHAFSLVLVAGSYCRNHDPQRVGLDDNGRPVDARDLFDPVWLNQVLADVFSNYYEGFTGERFAGDPPCDLDLLSRRLVEEMGVDRHMEETLRVAEQEAMSLAEFRDFLLQRGYDTEAVQGLTKGQHDIHVQTGPHLGGFNERISVPELTEYTAALCARSIMDRFCRSRFAGAESQPPESPRNQRIGSRPARAG